MKNDVQLCKALDSILDVFFLLCKFKFYNMSKMKYAGPWIKYTARFYNDKK